MLHIWPRCAYTIQGRSAGSLSIFISLLCHKLNRIHTEVCLNFQAACVMYLLHQTAIRIAAIRGSHAVYANCTSSSRAPGWHFQAPLARLSILIHLYKTIAHYQRQNVIMRTVAKQLIIILFVWIYTFLAEYGVDGHFVDLALWNKCTKYIF